MGNLATKLVIWIMHKSHFSSEARLMCVSALLKQLNGFPASDIISVDQSGSVLINGSPLDYEMAQKLRESAKYVLDSAARRLVREQVAFKAVSMGVHNGDTPEKVIFSRAALWWGQQEDDLYRFLAQE